MANHFQTLSAEQLIAIDGGGFLEDIAEGIGKAIPSVIEGAVKGFEELVDTAYNAGYRFGSYLESKFK